MASYCLTFGLLIHSRLCRSKYYPSKKFSLASYLEFNKYCLILMKADDTRASVTFACLPLFRFDIPFLRRGGRVVLHHVWSWVNYQCRGVLLIGIIEGGGGGGRGGARAYCACSRCGWGLFGNFYSPNHFSPLSPPLWETARHELKY